MTTYIGIEALAHKFQILKPVGQGRYSEVFLVRNKYNKNLYALKKVQLFGLCQYQIENCLQQALILYSSHHTSIIRIYECYHNSQQEVIYIVLEYAQKGDLNYMLQKHKQTNTRFNQSFIWKFLIQITDGLNYLHRSSVWHRDIKPANIFITREGFKIGDFNISQIATGGEVTVYIEGTPYYISPEKYLNKKQDEKSDIWSLGMICYELCCLSNPNSTIQLNAIQTIPRPNYLNFEAIPPVYSITLQQIIRAILSKVEKRPSSSDILKYCSRCGLRRKIKKTNIFSYIKPFLSSFDFANKLSTTNILQEFVRYKKLGQFTLFKSISFIQSNISINSKQQKAKRKSIKLKKVISPEQKLTYS